MKYLAIASLAAVAAASPAVEARGEWDPVPATWNTWDTMSATWSAAPVPAVPATWNEWDTMKAPAPTSTWATWEGYPPKPTDNEIDWEEWHKHPAYTTTVVTAITTYCPEPTTIVHAGKTWVVSTATTLTITDCPCTVSVPVWTKTSTSCNGKPTPDSANTWANTPVNAANTWANTPVNAASTWANTPVNAASTWANTPVNAASTWANTPVGASSTVPAQWSTVKAPMATWTGAASKLNVGAGLAGIVGAAALLL